jgi:predicted nucleic acid-binding protein
MTATALFPVAVGSAEFVLDVFTAITWMLTQHGTRYTSGVLGRMSLTTVAVPVSWPAELADAVRNVERKKLKTRAEADRFLAGFGNFRILVDRPPSTPAWTDLLPLARTHNITVYSAAYLELARRLALPLASVDNTLLRAAGAAGVPIFTP